MNFRIRTGIEILNSMVSYFKHATNKVTDFSIGSAIRTLLEAVSLQIEELYFRMNDGFQWAIENSIYKAFGFERNPATKASGMLTIEFINPLTSPLYLPQNTKFCTSSPLIQTKYYILTENTIIPIGAKSINIPVEAVLIGSQGNTLENTINVLITANSLIARVYNPIAFTNGKEKESLEECKKRFKAYIKSIGKATGEAIEYGVSQVEGVSGLYVDTDNVGFIVIYVHDSNGELPDSLKAKVEEAAISYKAAGIGVEVYPIEKVIVNISIKVYLNSGYDKNIYKSLVENTIKNYFNTFQAKKSFYITQFTQQVMSIDRLAIINIALNNPESDIIISKKQLIRLGTLNIEIIQDNE